MRLWIVALMALGLAVPTVSAEVNGSPEVEAADPEHGRQLYMQYCRGCHGADGRGGGHTFMPHVDTLTRAGYIELVPDEYLFLVIAEGGQAVGKSTYMPAWGPTLSDEDIWDLIAFIRSLPLY